MEVAALTAFLAPLLPHLLKIGDRVGEVVAENVGDEVVGFARRLWDRLRGKVEAKEAAREAVEDLAAAPDDEDLRIALKVQLRKLLDEDSELAADVERLWREAQLAGAPQLVNTVTASGAGAVAIGGYATGSTVTTSVQGQPGRADRPRD
jgi:hypothetical protein